MKILFVLLFVVVSMRSPWQQQRQAYRRQVWLQKNEYKRLHKSEIEADKAAKMFKRMLKDVELEERRLKLKGDKK